jgi:hypothetical protein
MGFFVLVMSFAGAWLVTCDQTMWIDDLTVATGRP